MKMRHSTEQQRQRRSQHQNQLPQNRWRDSASRHHERQSAGEMDFTTPEKPATSSSQSVRYPKVPSRQCSKTSPVDYSVAPQSHPRLVLYPSAYRPSYIPTKNPWAAPPPGPAKTGERSAQNLGYPSGGSSFLPPSTTAFVSSPFSKSLSLFSPTTCPVTPPTMGQNPLSPPCPIRNARVKTLSHSKVKVSPSAMEVDDKDDEEEPTKVVVHRNPYPIQPIVYENIGMPHLRVYKVKLPQTLIDTCLNPIMKGAEQHAQSLRHGWKTELYSLTKCDVACSDIPGIANYVQPVFEYICQAIHVLYGTTCLMVDKNQPHVLKYSAAMGHTGGTYPASIKK